MSAALEPGMFVECIDVHLAGTEPWEPVVGGIYCVSDVDDYSARCPFCGTRHGDLNLVEDPFRSDKTGWAVCEFRPVYKPKAEFITSLLQPAPELETA